MNPKFESGIILLASYLVIVEVLTFFQGRCAANYFSQDFLQNKLEVSTAVEEMYREIGIENPETVATFQWRGTRGGAVGSDG
jgi:hypothetical protein